MGATSADSEDSDKAQKKALLNDGFVQKPLNMLFNQCGIDGQVEFEPERRSLRIHDHCQTANDKNLASCPHVLCMKHINICT